MIVATPTTTEPGATLAYWQALAERFRAALRVELNEEIEDLRRLVGGMSPEKQAFYIDHSPKIQRLRGALGYPTEAIDSKSAG